MKIKTSAPSALSYTQTLELERGLPILFCQTYPQVLTHNDLSQTNILINKGTFEIMGVADWSLAEVQPFGMELDSLSISNGLYGPQRLAQLHMQIANA
ncbi:hypothetical protein BJX64DRAFT_265633 [Aspergillus heterothallicus]